MNRDEYLKLFERHLRVGGPKRQEILAELKTHVDELRSGSDASDELGNPRTLAIAHNRVHLGFFHTAARFYLTPILGWSVILTWIFLPNVFGWSMGMSDSSGLAGSTTAQFFSFSLSLVGLGFVLLAALRYARSLTMMHRSRRSFVRMASGLFLSGILVFLLFLLPTYIGGGDSGSIPFWQAMLISLPINAVVTTLWSVFLLISTVVYQRFLTKKEVHEPN